MKNKNTQTRINWDRAALLGGVVALTIAGFLMIFSDQLTMSFCFAWGVAALALLSMLIIDAEEKRGR